MSEQMLIGASAGYSGDRADAPIAVVHDLDSHGKTLSFRLLELSVLVPDELVKFALPKLAVPRPVAPRKLGPPI